METTFAKLKVLSFEGSLMKRPQLVQDFEKGSRKKRERGVGMVALRVGL